MTYYANKFSPSKRAPLAPETLEGKERTYHYQDVRVYVKKQLLPPSEESIRSIGVRRGDDLKLTPRTTAKGVQSITIGWQRRTLGTMKPSQLWQMVWDWMADGLPVCCKVASTGGKEGLLIELGFYGRPHFKTIEELLTPAVYAQCRREFIAFDVETTGLSRVSDRMIEISAVRFENLQPTDSFATLINCGKPVPAAAAFVNHITDADLQTAPDEAQAVAAFLEFVGPACRAGRVPLAAHNAEFDSTFLQAALKRHGLSASLQTCDTLPLTKHFLHALPDHKLQTVAEALQIDQRNAHRAEDDARVCGEILCALLTHDDKKKNDDKR